MVKELERVGRPVDPKDIDIVILSGLTSQYDAEVRMLESSSDWPTRTWIERAVINQFERLESEKSDAGTKALAAVRGLDRNSADRNVNCTLCSRAGHTAATCQEFKVMKRNPKDGGKRGGGGNGGNGRGNCQGKSRTANKGGKNHQSPSSNGDDKKTVRSGFYFCEGPHKSSDCPNRTNSTAPASTSNGPKAGGMIAKVKIVGARLVVNARAGAALSAGVTTLDECATAARRKA